MVEETPRVLVVDDDEPIRRMLCISLELDGFEVASAGDGLEAIIQVGLFCPDVVVLDIMMPRMDGLTALGHLRRQPETADIPVVLLSAKAESTDIAIGIRAGASDYVTKPFEAEDLVTRIRQVITPSSAGFGRERTAASRAPATLTTTTLGQAYAPAPQAVAAATASTATAAAVPTAAATSPGARGVLPPPPKPLPVPTTLPAIPRPPQQLPSAPTRRLSHFADPDLGDLGHRRRVAAAVLVVLILVAVGILALARGVPGISI